MIVSSVFKLPRASMPQARPLVPVSHRGLAQPLHKFEDHTSLADWKLSAWLGSQELVRMLLWSGWENPEAGSLEVRKAPLATVRGEATESVDWGE